MKIAVDIDDTLNIVERAKRARAYFERKNLPFKIVNETTNWFREVSDWTDSDVLEFMRDGGLSSFTEAEARKGAREALTRWREDGNEVIILTARHKEWFVNPDRVSRDWLEKRKIPYDEIVAETWEKGKYCVGHGISVLVDDNPDILHEAQRLGIYAVCAVGRHNLDRVHEFRYYGENWQQIESVVRSIYTK